ncbi:kelch repeat-containing protein [Sphingobacterium arenae]|uniref:Galactose oxidase n=1 Tax=Sphingobacterium arenae TaxID=1280598 RepID=A0ABR7Y844_9SPHI|nr:kelch repeat-containing protein [Sphingobacterium arenae]MBD1427455.1 galactose oxidase [Sphingobacterium arenae]
MTVTSVYAQINISFKWDTLANVPDDIGFAGSFAGVWNNTLIVAGGANFPDGGAPWTGSKKVWHDQIFALDSPDGEWKVIGNLPTAVGYGVSITCDKGLILIGGSTHEKHIAEVRLLQYDGKNVTFKHLPDLPKPVANSTGVILNNVVYVLGGTLDPTSKETENNFWSLDLNKSATTWKMLDSWPGPSRMLAIAGVQDGAIYLFSGTHLKNGDREYLKDAYKYKVGRGWERITDLPHAIVAAPSPAFAVGNDNLVVFGGDNGSQIGINLKKEKHPGFSKTVLSYNTKHNNWTEVGAQPSDAAVTTPLVIWNNKAIIPGGEISPSVRTTKVVVAEAIKTSE